MIHSLKISDIAKLFNIPVSALRYYEKEGLCSFRRSGNNYRFADIRTIRNLCDISFYRKLSCSIDQIRRLGNMNRHEINTLLTDSRIKVEKQINELEQMLENIDEKLERIRKIDRLISTPPSVVHAALPEIREFNLFRPSDISHLIDYEKHLFIIIDPNDVPAFRYGLSTDFCGDDSKELIHPKDETEKLYFKALLKTDYEKIEKNNLEEYYEQIAALGYIPGNIFGKVLVSADEGGLSNYYEAWIELLNPNNIQPAFNI